MTLVSEGPVGGRSVWHSLLPSKVWLSAADTAGLLAELPFSSGGVPTPAEILPHLQQLKQQWNNQQAEVLAIQVGTTLDDLAPIFAAHPTLSELAFAAARQT
ncbi:MAG: hypothetical protein KC449_15340 [Anaerolineales bacterium]|nr:hypothetical protein [Anaerolineales bacterium]